MKRILLPIFAFLLFVSFNTHAQTATTKKAATSTTKTKKDGTPDKRFKENKAAAKQETKHLKKDGTPDKRYKENQK